MSHGRPTALDDRKMLLAARAELDRVQVMLAVHDIKAIVAPAPDAARRARARRIAALLVGVVAPVFGRSRVGHWLRYASLAVAAFRIARNWRVALR